MTVWFPLFRDELSLDADHAERRLESQLEKSRKIWAKHQLCVSSGALYLQAIRRAGGYRRKKRQNSRGVGENTATPAAPRSLLGEFRREWGRYQAFMPRHSSGSTRSAHSYKM